MKYRKILALALACTMAFPVTAFAAEEEKATDRKSTRLNSSHPK